MTGIETYLNNLAPYVLSALRIFLGILFAVHGAQKLFGFPSPPEGGKPPLASLYGVAGLLEFFGGLVLAVGLFTRYVAFILAGQMAVAYFTVHAPRGFWPMKNDGESAVFFCLIFFYFVFAGGGPISLDALLLNI
jgi:putative oxidoreductase